MARVRLGAQGRVEDRHQLRLPRRLGDRRDAAPRGGRLGRQRLRRGPAPGSPATRRPRRSCSISSARCPRAAGSRRPARASRTSTSARAAACARGRTARARRSRARAARGARLAACAFCRLVHADEALAWQVHADCEPLAAIRSVPGSCFRRRSRPTTAGSTPTTARRRPIGPIAAPASARSGSASLSFVYPREDAFVYVPSEIDGSLGRVVFEAAHRDPRRARLLAPRRRVPGRDRRAARDGARAAAGGAPARARRRARRDASSGVSRSWREAAPVLLRFQAGL